MMLSFFLANIEPSPQPSINYLDFFLFKSVSILLFSWSHCSMMEAGLRECLRAFKSDEYIVSVGVSAPILAVQFYWNFVGWLFTVLTELCDTSILIQEIL